jgi:3-oxosteroid 1-dehydrogenase
MNNASTLEPEYDVVIVGSGGASMCAALALKQLGKTTVILEKESRVGGSTAFSGGVIWVPANPLMARAGIADSYEKGKTYLESVVTHVGPAVTPKRRDAFLKAAPRMITFLEQAGLKLRLPVDQWPDYYDDAPGGEPQGRSLMAANFDINELGAWAEHLAVYDPVVHMPIGSDEFSKLALMRRTWGGKLKALKLGVAMLRNKLFRRRFVANGAALQGRMLQLTLRAAIPIFTGTPVIDLIVEERRVVGVRARQGERVVEVRARQAVIVNSGGFARNAQMREKYQRPPITSQWTNANPGDTGEILDNMIRLGAATDCMDAAWWVITSKNINGEWPKGAVMADGRVFPFLHHLDLSFPFSILVDQAGHRFCDEAGSYVEIGERMYDRQAETGRAVPSWVIFDQRHRERYIWGSAPPGVTPPEWIDSGYMKKAQTLEALAAQCGIDPAGLGATVERFNGFCRTGTDTDFRRGGRAFDRSHGDPTVKPNPNLGAIEQAPFYAVAIYAGDVGTCGGVVTDEYGRVLRNDASLIPGLYAVGNSAASVFGRTYPGAGASIAVSFASGWIAAQHAGGSRELERTLS